MKFIFFLMPIFWPVLKYVKALPSRLLIDLDSLFSASISFEVYFYELHKTK